MIDASPHPICENLKAAAFEGCNGSRMKCNPGRNTCSPSRRHDIALPQSEDMMQADRLDDNERFVTIAHELGHIFLGRLGQCTSRSGIDEESGWPDRQSLGKNEQEVEAEAVVYLVSSRAGLVAASAQYLKTYATCADMLRVDFDLIVRSAARIERMCKIRYGSMEFKAESNFRLS